MKLATRAKPDLLLEVLDGQRLTIDFVVSSVTAKSSRLNFLIPGSLVRVQPGVLQKLAGTMPAHREPTGVGKAKRGTMPRLCVTTVRWFESSRAYSKNWRARCPPSQRHRRCPSKVTPEGEGLAWSRPADQAMEVSGKARADVETTTR